MGLQVVDEYDMQSELVFPFRVEEEIQEVE